MGYKWIRNIGNQLELNLFLRKKEQAGFPNFRLGRFRKSAVGFSGAALRFPKSLLPDIIAASYIRSQADRRFRKSAVGLSDAVLRFPKSLLSDIIAVFHIRSQTDYRFRKSCFM